MTAPRRSMRVAAGLLAGAVAAGAVLLASSPPPTGAQGQGDARGAALYARSCASCHGIEATGTRRGPTLEGQGAAGTHLQITTGRMPPPPSERGRPVPTPPTDLSDADARAIAEHVATLVDGPPIPTVDAANAAPLHRGLELYLENCASCHGSTGAGSALTLGRTTPRLSGDLTDVQVAEAILSGPGTMPRFGPDVFEQEDRDALVAYVAELRSPADRGGASLGRLGPVVEGLLVFFVVLPLLVLLLMRLGRSADEREDVSGAVDR